MNIDQINEVVERVSKDRNFDVMFIKPNEDGSFEFKYWDNKYNYGRWCSYPSNRSPEDFERSLRRDLDTPLV